MFGSRDSQQNQDDRTFEHSNVEKGEGGLGDTPERGWVESGCGIVSLNFWRNSANVTFVLCFLCHFQAPRSEARSAANGGTDLGVGSALRGRMGVGLPRDGS